MHEVEIRYEGTNVPNLYLPQCGLVLPHLRAPKFGRFFLITSDVRYVPAASALILHQSNISKLVSLAFYILLPGNNKSGIRSFTDFRVRLHCRRVQLWRA